MSIHNPFSLHGFNSLTVWSQICCVYFDKVFPSLFFRWLQTDKRVIWAPGGDREVWHGQQARGWGRSRTGDWDPTSWAILDDS